MRLISAARRGDAQAGRQAEAILAALKNAPDQALRTLAGALERLLFGLPPQEALATLPPDLQQQILAWL